MFFVHFFLILHLTTILTINYIFIIDLNLNFLRIKKYEHTCANLIYLHISYIKYI